MPKESNAPIAPHDPRTTSQLYCPQCGEDTPELHEGYCAECCEENQRRLDLHNARYDRWQAMSDRERADEIRRSM